VKVIVFDLGGTLMEFNGMPNSWIDYYKTAFTAIKDSLHLSITDSDIELSCKILTEYNPRISNREIEYTPEKIFNDVVAHWNIKIDISVIISEFFKGLELQTVIYNDSLECLQKSNFKIAALTDLPTAMSDELFKSKIEPIIENLDLYVSSLSCGFRKPNANGIKHIAEYFDVNMDSVLFVGDEIKDIKTAQNAGCKSVLITRNNSINREFGQDYNIKSLNELFDIL
jgi:putative hydrolase of the HAD superfamily